MGDLSPNHQMPCSTLSLLCSTQLITFPPCSPTLSHPWDLLICLATWNPRRSLYIHPGDAAVLANVAFS